MDSFWSSIDSFFKICMTFWQNWGFISIMTLIIPSSSPGIDIGFSPEPKENSPPVSNRVILVANWLHSFWRLFVQNFHCLFDVETLWSSIKPFCIHHCKFLGKMSKQGLILEESHAIRLVLQVEFLVCIEIAANEGAKDPI